MSNSGKLETLVNLRRQRNLSQQDVADYLEISRQAYCNYEVGKRMPDYETLLKLGEFFNVSVDYLLRGDMEDAKRVFADNLHTYLNRTGHTQLELAEYMGVSSSTVSDWCAGSKYPRVDKMQRMAEYFGVTMSALTSKEEPLVNNDAELTKYLDELKNRKEMRMLFSLAAGATKEDVERTVKIVEAALGKQAKDEE